MIDLAIVLVILALAAANLAVWLWRRTHPKDPS